MTDEKIINIFTVLILILIFIASYLELKNKKKKKKKIEKYEYVDNKRIIRKNVSLFKDIPCNNDIYYANCLINLNNFGYDITHIVGAIIFKWFRNKKVSFSTKIENNRKLVFINLTKNFDFDNKLEKRLFDIMYSASSNGILEEDKFGVWCRKNKRRVLDLLNDFYDETFNSLKNKNLISVSKDKEKNNKKYVMSLSLYEDSVRLYGLKKYLLCYSETEKKEIPDDFAFDNYLMFAYLFGITDLVCKQFKKVLEFKDIRTDTIDYINRFAYKTSESIGMKYKYNNNREDNVADGFYPFWDN